MSTQIEAKLWNGYPSLTNYPDNEKWHGHLLDQYKLYVEMADRISQRRATANTYFLSLNSAIIAFVGYLTSKDSTELLWILAVAGIVLSILWRSIITSYRNLNTAKWAIVHLIEKRLPISPYDAEWELVKRGTSDKDYKPISHIEGNVPWIFLGLHAIVLFKTMWNDTFVSAAQAMIQQAVHTACS